MQCIWTGYNFSALVLLYNGDLEITEKVSIYFLPGFFLSGQELNIANS